jgi:CDP-diacylglycerol--serine O-phosphatidyltransferase
MVSNVLYFSFKELDFRKRLPFVAAFFVVAALVLASIRPSVILFAGFCLYGLSGVVFSLVRRRRRASRVARSGEQGDREK